MSCLQEFLFQEEDLIKRTPFDVVFRAGNIVSSAEMLVLCSFLYLVYVRIAGPLSNEVSGKNSYIFDKRDMGTNYEISSLIYYEIPAEIS